jgi:hypothetical protein
MLCSRVIAVEHPVKFFYKVMIMNLSEGVVVLISRFLLSLLAGDELSSMLKCLRAFMGVLGVIFLLKSTFITIKSRHLSVTCNCN